MNKKTDIWLWLGILRDSNHKIKSIKLSVLTIVFQCFSWVWGFCPSCPYDETHFFVKSPYRLRPTCVPLCKARWKVPGVGTSARNGGAPKSWSRSFTTGATVSDGGVRVWLDFVWCQRTSAEIKIEIQSTSFNFGEKTGVQSLTKKGIAYFDVVHPQKVYYRVPGFTFWVGHSTIVHDRLCVPAVPIPRISQPYLDSKSILARRDSIGWLV